MGNHAGWFEFKLCENNNIYQDSDQSCFDKHLLEFTDGSTRVHVGPMGPAGKGIFSYQVKLPQGVTCEQCVIQWHYNGGQNWGCDADTGKCCEGCGPQETFWGCSDVAITGGGPNPPTIPPIPETTTVPNGPVTLEPTTTAGPKPGPGKKCHAISPYNNQPGMDDWCKENVFFAPIIHSWLVVVWGDCVAFLARSRFRASSGCGFKGHGTIWDCGGLWNGRDAH